MPELAILPPSGLSIPTLSILPPSSYFDRAPIPAPIADTSKLSKAQGKAALFGSIADTLAKLPETLMSAYQTGKKMATGNKTVNAYNAALTGNPVAGTSLADFKATGEGAVTFDPATGRTSNPLDDEYRRAQIEHLKRADQPKPSFYEREAATALPGRGGSVRVPGQPATDLPNDDPDPTLTIDPNDPDNLDYLDGNGAIKPNTSTGIINDNPTEAERSSALLPPATHTEPPKPKFRGGATVPLSQLSGFQPSAPVAPQDAAAIEGAAMNIGNQLTRVQPASALGASTDAVPAAAITPVSREQALATFAESPQNREGFSQEQTGSKTIDPATGVITLKTDDGREFILTPGANGYQEVKPRGGLPTIPATIRAEAIRMGVYKDGMTAEQVGKAMEEKQITDGAIPPHLLPVAQSMARIVVGHPALKHYPTIKEAKEAVDAGIANPGAGGFSDMALIEGFQRMVNPGASVRSQTIQSMMDAAGYMQKIDPKFLWGKAVVGDKFNDEARKRLKVLADDIFKRSTEAARPQLNALGKIAKSYGIPNAEQFVNNAMILAPLEEAHAAAGTPAAPGAPARPALPSATPSPKDTQAATWAKANPTDPRAAAIKAAQQAKGIWVD